MSWSWTIIIPQTMLTVGAWLLLISFPIQWITPENSRVALWFALIGGFGVGGGTGGWLGQALTGTTTAVASVTQQITAQLVGAGFAVLIFAILAILFWQKAGSKGQGLQSKGGKKKDKLKQMVGLLVFAMLGTAVSAIPMLYSWADQGVDIASGFLLQLLP